MRSAQGTISHTRRAASGLDRRLARKQNSLFDLRHNRIAQGLWTVAEDHRTHAEVVIDQAIAIDIMQIRAIPAFEYERRRRDVEAEIAVDASGDPLGIIADFLGRSFE